MKIKDIANKKNLHLAWSRITAGGNFQYKRLFRSIYYAYEIALQKNLDNLSERILGGSYTPLPPERVFIPKPSGLHRPLTLLHLEDQIVLQAFANLAALRMQKARSPLQRKCVFSNIVEHSDSPFFFLRWQKSYQAFQERIKDSFNSGMIWVGDFDLAAFYDTISHELLIKTIYPRSPVSDSVWILDCLKVWSSNDSSSSHAHGLPQGPIASDYLAECFLLPVDKVMMNGKGYLRYVDDVRLLGASENKVRHDLIKLELCCKARGLIPQAGKFKIKKAENCEEAMGMLPSISDPQNTDLTIYKESSKHISSIFFKSIQGNPPQVADKTRLRYSLYRASIDTKILMQVLLLVKSHPEHTDALFFYIQRFKYRKQIEDVCLDVIRSCPYSYTKGEAWHVLAQYASEHSSQATQMIDELVTRAIGIARSKSKNQFHEKWGSARFLCAVEELRGDKLSKFLVYQPPLLQALVASSLPEQAFLEKEVVASFLKRSSPEPGLSICAIMHQRNYTPASFNVSNSNLSTQVQNTLQELGLLTAIPSGLDPIAEMLYKRYKTPRIKSWKTLLGSEYTHTLGFLKQAEASFKSGPSNWLALQNSFNHAIFIALQNHFSAVGHPGKCMVKDKNGEIVNFGSSLDRNKPFAKECKTIADGFRAVNTRRNSLPSSHPYDKKTGNQSMSLRPKEKNQLLSRLQAAYGKFVLLMP